jgi:hypothetical protein
MSRGIRVGLVLVLLVGAAGIGWWRSQPASRGLETLDLAITSARAKVRADRRVDIVVEMINRDRRPSAAADLYLLSSWGEKRAPQAPLHSGESRIWSWTSPPLVPGDHAIVLSLEPVGSIDRDETDNRVRRVIHVPSAVEATSGGATARMPSVIGLDHRDAVRALEAADVPSPRWYVYSGSTSTDRIEQQWPEPGEPLPRGTRPVLVVEARRAVPDVRGMPIEQARARLDQAGLTSRVETRPALGPSRPNVRAQDPAPGASIALASAVRLSVADPMPLWPYAMALAMVVLAALLSFGPGSHARAVAAAGPAGLVGPPATRPVAGTPAEARVATELQIVPVWDPGEQETAWQEAAERPVALRAIDDSGHQVAMPVDDGRRESASTEA